MKVVFFFASFVTFIKSCTARRSIFYTDKYNLKSNELLDKNQRVLFVLYKTEIQNPFQCKTMEGFGCLFSQEYRICCPASLRDFRVRVIGIFFACCNELIIACARVRASESSKTPTATTLAAILAGTFLFLFFVPVIVYIVNTKIRSRPKQTNIGPREENTKEIYPASCIHQDIIEDPKASTGSKELLDILQVTCCIPFVAQFRLIVLTLMLLVVAFDKNRHRIQQHIWPRYAKVFQRSLLTTLKYCILSQSFCLFLCDVIFSWRLTGMTIRWSFVKNQTWVTQSMMISTLLTHTTKTSQEAGTKNNECQQCSICRWYSATATVKPSRSGFRYYHCWCRT